MSRSAFDDIIDQVARPGAPGGAAAVWLDGALVFERGFGLADVAAGRAFAARDRFHVCSITKTFTGALAGLLEQAGRLNFADAVRRYLPAFPDYGAPLTLEHLATNTSGLRDYFPIMALEQGGRAERYDRGAMERHALAQPSLMFAPGVRYSYSNSNFVVLCRVIEAVGGRPYAEALAARIAAPLGLADTLFLTETTPEPPGAAVGHVRDADGFVAPRLAVHEAGDGGVWSTAADLAAWGAALIEDRVGRPGLTERLTTPGHFADGSLAWYARGFGTGRRGPHRWFGHSGGLSGMSTNLTCFPEARLVIAVGSNGPLAEADDLATQLADAVLGAPPAEAAQPSGDGDLDRWSGVWQSDGCGQTATLAAGEGHVDLWILGWSVRLVGDGDALVDPGSGACVRRAGDDAIDLRAGHNAFIRMRRVAAPDAGESAPVGRFRGTEAQVTLSLKRTAHGLQARIEGAPSGAAGFRLDPIARGVRRLIGADGSPTGGVITVVSPDELVLSLPRAEKLRFERIP